MIIWRIPASCNWNMFRTVTKTRITRSYLCLQTWHPRCFYSTNSYFHMKSKIKPQKKIIKIRTWQVQWGVVKQIRKLLVNKNTRETFFFWEVGYELTQNVEDFSLNRKDLSMSVEENQFGLIIKGKKKNELKEKFGEIVQCDNSRHFEKLEKELIRQLPVIDLPLILYFADGLFLRAYHLSKEENCLKKVCSNYYIAMLNSLSFNWEKLNFNISHVVQLLFYASLYRVCRPELLFKIEEYIERNIQDATIKEITVLCYAFFALNHSIKLQLTLQGISEKVLTHFESLDLISLSNIMKALRHSGYSRQEFYKQLGDLICQTGLFKNSLFSKPAWITHISHILVTYSSIRYIHRDLLKEVLSKLKDDLPNILKQRIRQKDLVRLLFALQNSGCHIPVEISDKLREELLDLVHNKDDYTYAMYAESFIEGMLVLACEGIYEKELFQRVFDPKYMNLKARASSLEHNFQHLLFKELCDFHFPDENIYPNFLTYYQMGNLKKELQNRQGLASAIISFQELLGGASFVKYHFIMSFTSILDIEFHLDAHKQAIEIQRVPESNPECLPQNYPTGLTGRGHILDRKKPENVYIAPSITNNETKVCVKLFGWNQFGLNEPVLRCVHRMELEMLAMKGYHVFGINPSDAARFSDWPSEKKRNYIETNIMDVLKNKL